MLHYLYLSVEACVAEWLRPRPLDLEVKGSSLTPHIVYLDKELYSTFSLFTQVYKWVPATYCWEGNPVRDWHSGQGGVAILLHCRHASC